MFNVAAISMAVGAAPLLAQPPGTAAADGTTGDVRKVVSRLTSHFFAWYNGTVVDENNLLAIDATLTPGSFKTRVSFLGKQRMDLSFATYVEFPSMFIASESEG